eukprot:scaffold71920_cov45-Phaeocystis_antarctica.AAC.4
MGRQVPDLEGLAAFSGLVAFFGADSSGSLPAGLTLGSTSPRDCETREATRRTRGDGPRVNSFIWLVSTSSEPASQAEDIPHHS